MHAIRSTSKCSRALALRNFCSATRSQNAEGPANELQSVQAALEEALEGVNYIRQSAHQAFLETEPGTRSTSEEYMMRYQTFARDDLKKAIGKHDALMKTIGKNELSKLSEQNKSFRLTLADSLLAKEKLDAALKRNAAKIADREALTSRAEHQAGFVNQDPCKPAWELPM